MRSCSPARVVIASLVVAAVITLGCGKPPTAPTAPTPTLTPGPEPSASQRLAALALFEAASVHAEATTSPLTYGTENGQVMFTDGPCAFDHGSMRGSLDGGSAPKQGTFLPTGSHTYVVSFSNCYVNYWGAEVIELNGVASAAYSAADWSNLNAMVSANSVRGQELLAGGRSALRDVTADGSAVWTRSSTTTTYTPGIGSRLVNNSTTNVATFGGGSYSVVWSSSQSPPSRSERFDNLKVAINGTEYSLNGNLVEFSTSSITRTGEIRIINNGTLVARIYGDGGNALRIEVLVPLVSL